MISAYCPRHGGTVLLSLHSVVRLINTDEGIVLELECYDGERVRVYGGRARERGGVAGELAKAAT